jgi:hypothetical protein
MAELDGGSNDREIFNILRTHGSDIATLRTAVGSIQHEQHSIVATLNQIRDSLSDQRAATGPGIKEVLGLCALGGGLISMVAGAITVLVLSIFQPGLTELKTTSAGTSNMLHNVISERAREHAEELKDLRKERDRRQHETDKALSDRLKQLEDRLSGVGAQSSAMPSRWPAAVRAN